VRRLTLAEIEKIMGYPLLGEPVDPKVQAKLDEAQRQRERDREYDHAWLLAHITCYVCDREEPSHLVSGWDDCYYPPFADRGISACDECIAMFERWQAEADERSIP